MGEYLEASRTVQSTSPQYKMDQLMIRTVESQTQQLMPAPELFYRYFNCHQREKARLFEDQTAAMMSAVPP